MCGSTRRSRRAQAEPEDARDDQERSAAAVQGLHHRPLQPHGAQPPRQPLLLQEGTS